MGLVIKEASFPPRRGDPRLYCLRPGSRTILEEEEGREKRKKHFFIGVTQGRHKGWGK